MCREIQLPNITGTVSGTNAAEGDDKGAFSIAQNGLGGITVGGYGRSTHNFDASKSNQTYSGSTFQPRAGLTLLCIKV